MYKVLIFLSALAVWGCRKASDAGAAPKPPEAAAESAPSTAEPMYSTEVRKPLISPQPLQEYRKYTGTIEGKLSLTMDLTFTDHGSGLYGHGQYWYGQDGISKGAHAEFFDADRFEFELWDSTGNFILATLTGRFTSLEAFEGMWTRYQPDSILQDPKYGTWKKTRIRREQAPLKLVRTMEGVIPVRFEVFRKANDSTSRLKIQEHRAKAPYDSSPSSLDLVILRVQSGRPSIDSMINLGIDRAMKEFCLSLHENTIPPETPISSIADSLFDRGWADMHGEFFDDKFDTEVEANENGVLSLRFTWSNYSGGAHPNEDHVYASIDMATGRTIGLKDILVPDYHDRLGSLAGVLSCNGDSENPCNIEGLVKKGFAIRHNGIVFYANIGLQDRDVFIDYRELASLIKKGGILERFILVPAR